MASIETQAQIITTQHHTLSNTDLSSPVNTTPPNKYKLYPWRFPGAFSLIVFSFVTGLIYPWFGAISVEAARELHISVRGVNWLGISLNIVFLPVSLATPFLCSILGTWIRFLGVSKHHGGLGGIVIGQIILGIAEPIFLIVGPKFSQAWFDFDGRTTVTMLISVANPVGAGVGQIIPSFLGSTRHSVLILGFICTAISPLALLIRSAPPTPPTFSGGEPSPNPFDTLRALFGKSAENRTVLPFRTRLDFFIICYCFGVFVGAVNGFALLTGQLFRPYGYSDTQSGLFGACLLLTGLGSSAVTSPLFDRVFTRYITISIKCCIFILGGAWLSLIWAVKPHDRAGIFVTVTAIGSTSLTLLPLALELGCDLLQDAETSSAILWCLGNLFTIIFVLVEGSLTDGPHASPPLNMHRATIFAGVMACSAGLFGVIGLKGLKNSRRELDAQRQREQEAMPGGGGGSKSDIPLASRHSVSSSTHSEMELTASMP
ncbi:hypothetical protein Clacol_005018 [Clathrus columnatus]|uniref:MFS general substrate transporter n=1 Tax=Clathrus columnatus TaxID=1419009 RepID=A0AAV5AD02_9AGAM|nr:hypothetical protein Clacol_005018 [Clathrus columnatus]